jgi:hypothetical protein
MSYDTFFAIYMMVGSGYSTAFENVGIWSRLIIILFWPFFMGRFIGVHHEKSLEQTESKACPHGHKNWDDCPDCGH